METIFVNGVDVSDYVLSFNSEIMIGDDMHLLGNAVCEKVTLGFNNYSGILNGCAAYPFIIDGKIYYVDAYPERYTKELNIELFDSMILLNRAYHSALPYEAGTTVQAQLEEISRMTGVSIDTSNLTATQLTTPVNWIDTSCLMRQYVGWIAERCGYNAMVSADNRIVFRPLANARYDLDVVADYIENERITISKVAWDDGLDLYEVGTDEGNTLFLDNTNLYCRSDAVVQAIYDQYVGFAFHSFTGLQTRGIPGLCMGDMVRYDGMDFLCLSIQETYEGGDQTSLALNGDIQIKNNEKTIERVDERIRIKKIQTTLDQQEQKLTILAVDTEDAMGRIAQLEIDTESIATTVSELEEGLQDTVAAEVKAILDIGGRNLVLESEAERQAPILYRISPRGITKGQYTLSFDAIAEVDCLMDVLLEDESGESRVALTFAQQQLIGTQWQRMSFTVESKQEYIGNDGILLRFQGASEGALFSIRNVKLEKGIVATDYTPAPEDIQNQFGDVDERIDEVVANTTSEIAQTKEEIRLSVSENYYSKDAMDQQLASMESSITQSVETITLSFEQFAALQEAINQEYDDTFRAYFQFSADGMLIGKSNSSMKQRLTADRQSFGTVKTDGTLSEQSYITPSEIHNKNLVVDETLTMGGFQWRIHKGNYGLRKVGS